MAQPVRLLVADHHVVFVQCLCAELERHFEIVGYCHTGDELLRCLADSPADVVVQELDMPGRSWLELIPAVRSLHQLTRVLVLTIHKDRVLLDKAMSVGASGFVPKSDRLEDVVAAINEVHAGRLYTSRAVPPRTNQMGVGAAHLGMHRMTPQEQRVMKLIGAGKTSEEIAKDLGLSIHTVNTHRKNARRRLGISSKAGLIQLSALMSVGN